MFPFTDPVLIFTVMTAVMLIAPLLGARLRIPDLVVMLVAGAALGGHGFGVLERREAITLFGEIGLLYIMFLAGLEIDLYEFSRTRARSIGFGLTTFLIPQVLGAVAVHSLLGNLAWTSVILIASMFASHTLLAYPVASRLGIHRAEPVTITVGATIITDTLALLVLAVVLDISQGIALTPAFWLELGISLAVMVLVICLLVPRLARWFFKHVSESGGSQFLFVLTLVCACAYFSQYARMKPLIGAFLAGAALNRQIPEHSALMNRLQFVGNHLFIPFFLISVGMLVDPGVLLSDPYTWKVIGVMTGTVILTKWLAAQIAGLLFGYRAPERQVMFGLSVVQAAATLAAALVGYEAGLVDKAVLNGAIAMIMFTVPLGSWSVQRWGRILALRDTGASRVRRLEQRLLLPVRHPDSARTLMTAGLLLRDAASPGGLFPLTIVDDEHNPEQAVAGGEKLLAQCVSLAAAAGSEVDPQVRVDLNPVDGILRAARELRATTVLAGWGREAGRVPRLFGSIQHTLAEKCPARVILCRLPQPLQTNKNLRIPFPPLAEHRSDLSTLVQETKHLAKQAGLTIHVYLSGPAAPTLRNLFEKTSPGCETRFVVSPNWKESRQTLFRDHGADDLLVLPQIRRDTALWTPTLDRLPEMVAREFPRNNLMVVYPEIRSERDYQGPVSIPADEAFPEIRGVDLAPGDGPALIAQLVREGLPDAGELVEKAVPYLIDSARLTPVELPGNSLLLHAHCGHRDSPLLLAGFAPDLPAFFSQEKPPRLLLALLSPEDDAPEIHLRTLARVARRFRREGIAAELTAADSAAEICRVLSR